MSFNDEPPHLQFFIVGTFIIILVILATCFMVVLQGCCTVNVEQMEVHGRSKVETLRHTGLMEEVK
jgi:hypothetical protein